MSTKLYRLYCELCNYNRITDGTDIGDLVEYKRSKIQANIPKIDPLDDNKVKEKEHIKLPKQFKCPKCGRLIKPKKLDLKEEDEDIDK